MKRRIALAIFVTVWSVLFVAGLGTYVSARAALVAELDRTLLRRAMALPEVLQGESPAEAVAGTQDRYNDRYVVQNELGQTVARPLPSPDGGAMWDVRRASFARLADGTHVRTLTIGVTPADGEPMTVTYSGSMAAVDRVLGRLVAWLMVIGLCVSVVAAGLAVHVANRALRPLHEAVETVGALDEHRLDYRLEVQSLPPELAPVGQRLNALLERLQESFERQRRFLADASHELRTPVAALLTTLQVALRQPRNPDALLRYVQACLADAKLLRALTDALLFKVKADSKADADVIEEVEVVSLLESCTLVADGLALEPEITVARHLPPAPVFLQTQPNLLRSIVINLLSNAVEYNRPGGSVTLTCRRLPQCVEVEVQDSGVGITPDNLRRIFEPFFRVDPARAREGGHLGLGLSLVDASVRRLGGTIAAESQVGVGTRFVVRFPVEPLQQSAAATPDEADHPPDIATQGATYGAARITAHGEAQGARAPRGEAPRTNQPSVSCCSHEQRV